MDIVRKYLLSNVARAPEGGGASAGAGDNKGAAGAGGDNKGAAGDPWYKPFNLDADAVKFVEDRKFSDFGTQIKSHIEADKVARSRNVIEKPDPNKLADWEGHELLGWTKDRAKYAPKEPARKEGQHYDQTMFNDFVGLAHEHRVPAGAAEKLYQGMYDKMQERIGALAASQKADQDKAKAALDTALRGKWGGKYDENADLSKRALRALGVDEKKADKLNAILGDADMVELFHTIGSKLPEDSFTAAATGDGLPVTVAGLEAEIRRFQNEPANKAALNDERHAQHKDIVGQRQKLIDRLAQLKAKAAA